MASFSITLFIVVIVTFVQFIQASSQLYIQHDLRKLIPVTEFGFLQGGHLKLTLDEYQVVDKETENGIAAFYIRKGYILEDQYQIYHEEPVVSQCFLNNSFIMDEVNDGASIVEYISPQQNWSRTVYVNEGEEGLWQVLYISCIDSPISFKLTIEQVNPNNNHLSAGDIPLPYVYMISAVFYTLACFYWIHLLLFQRNTIVFKAHWLIFLLIVFIIINKVLQSMKYYYMRLGLLSEGWKIGFYVFAGIKGILSLLIIVLLASGWMFIKPFLSPKDKNVISIIIPLQVLANVVSAISSETAVGSENWSLWILLLPLFDLSSCGIILWTILQTRKHLASAISVDGKEQDILNKYKLWSSFYVVTLVYIYVTRIIVQLLQASLPFQYVNWFGESVNETATFLFYVFIGYKFRPYPNNPYIQVSTAEDEEEQVDNTIGLATLNYRQ